MKLFLIYHLIGEREGEERETFQRKFHFLNNYLLLCKMYLKFKKKVLYKFPPAYYKIGVGKNRYSLYIQTVVYKNFNTCRFIVHSVIFNFKLYKYYSAELILFYTVP